jgi:excisionase family DNA binding protein
MMSPGFCFNALKSPPVVTSVGFFVSPFPHLQPKEVFVNPTTPNPKSELPPTLQFFSTAEVAIILGASRKLVSSWVRDGQLPAFRMGPQNRIIRIRRQDLEAFIKKHTATNWAEATDSNEPS